MHLTSFSAPTHPKKPTAIVTVPPMARKYESTEREREEGASMKKLTSSNTIHNPRESRSNPRVKKNRLNRNRKYLMRLRQPCDTISSAVF
uniref:Uncharacterized protein n=1 Tax=Anguilla anguilla TaxID=7936 RepID=A0A0E9XSK1_ANGAN